ncbi:MAG: GNAT family N-acetyltransferase [Candidatus Viridilinea halotolerans]|uniref:GNAT family N-acetyltransferase n=1 Tax=Candidatus Viridilinea halotolerans TaxID=2491704 RepID=A0A426TZB3_9CHLR|nr:MAG: GNAT family N-acetyltransferase [Candidatus Viridilinea halotolerans]
MANIPWTRDIGNGLRMCAVGGLEDIERVAAFDALIHGAGSEVTWSTWMRDHPHMRASAWLFIEEAASRQVVASLCLIPWRIHYAGVELRSAEMGVVGTLPAYRGRRLQHVLNQRFAELIHADGFDLSHIQGIPYFYRQFGYEYALPLEAWWRLELHMVPLNPPTNEQLYCRLANLNDLPILEQLYAQAAAALDVAALRDEAVWRFLLGPALLTETAAETWLICDMSGTCMGYFRVARQGFGDGLIVAESSLLSPEAARVALAHVRQLAEDRAKPFVRLNLPAATTLVVVARSLGAHDGNSYGWQIRLPNPLGLLRKLAPVLNQRIAASIYAGLTRDIVLDFYRHACRLRFTDGAISAVEAVEPGTSADLQLPPQLFAPLLLGHRSLAEMNPMYPDASAPGASRPLIELLFPTLRGWLYMPY